MVDDVGSAQARVLLGELYGQVAELTHKLDAADERNRRARARGTNRTDPRAHALRRELHEACNLIDRLHRRFPDSRPVGRTPRTISTTAQR